MKYDDEYGTFKFTRKDMSIILDSLSYSYRNDKSLSEPDRDYVNDLYKCLNNSGVEYAN